MRKLFLIFCFFIAVNATAQTGVFTCGFECGVGTGAANTHWQTNGTSSFSTSTVRSGSRSARSNPTAATGAIRTLLSLSANIGVLRAYFNVASASNAINSIATFIVGGGKYPGLVYNSADGKYYAGYYDLIGTAIFTTGSTGVTLTAGWHRADIRINISANPWVIEVKIDGVDLGTCSPALAATTFSEINLGSNNTATCDIFYDDVVLSTTSADYPIGAGYVNHFVPTADGTHAANITANDFERTLTGTDIIASTTDSYFLLDDVPLESGSSVDWINMIAPVNSSYTENIFGPAPGISAPTTAPRAVEVIFATHAAGTGTYNAEWLLNDNGTTNSIFAASAVAGTTTIIYKRKHYATAPTGGAWTLSGAGNFNDLRIRFSSTAAADANPDVYFDCAMIEAEFSEAIATIPGTPSDKRHTTLGVGN